MTKRITISICVALCIVGGFYYAYAQSTDFTRGTAKHEHVLTGCSFWTFDEETQTWKFHNGVMPNRDTLRVTVPATASRDTLAEGYYPAIILIPETP